MIVAAMTAKKDFEMFAGSILELSYYNKEFFILLIFKQNLFKKIQNP